MALERQELRIQEAHRLLKTGSNLIGPDYLHSVLKRGLDLLIAGPTSAVALAPIAVCGILILAKDGQWPFVDVGYNSNPKTNKRDSF